MHVQRRWSQRSNCDHARSDTCDLTITLGIRLVGYLIMDPPMRRSEKTTLVFFNRSTHARIKSDEHEKDDARPIGSIGRHP